ncbi:hypothetical protein [Legionella cherrii]|uniref:Coiled-coil protein n=1 Tax=Legionella cherrii TaxID=28084 RepID=A0ABY6T4F6_9GAMM|nr:hypothetical protein [Legionella cherrii]VEB34696.1 Uncharacterised protein [Legionella cherrii]
MAKSLSSLSGFNKDVRSRLKNSIRKILSLDEEDISYDCYNAFAILKNAVWQAELFTQRTYTKYSVLDVLTDDDLLKVIAELEKSLPEVSAKIERMKDEVKGLKLLETQKDEIEKTLNECRTMIAGKRRILDKAPIPEEPGGWSIFIADKKPGLLKSIFLFFVPQTSIEAAQHLCECYEVESRVRQRLVCEIKTLSSNNEMLRTDLDSKQKQIQGLKTTQKFLKQAEKNIKILKDNFKVLEENATKLELSAKQKERTQTVAQKQNEEDDDLLFSLEM